MTATVVLRFLLASCALIAAGIAFTWHASDSGWTPPPAQPIDTALLALPPSPERASSEIAFVEIAQRPLFNADRRPSDSDESAASNGAGPDALRLIGLFASDPAGGAILLMGDDTLRIRLGEQAEGLTLREIGPRHAVLVGADGDATRLELVRARNSATDPDTDKPFRTDPDGDDEDDFPNRTPAPAQQMTGPE